MYKSILVPLDGSARAERILPHVEPLAQRFEARLILLRVIEPAGSLPPPNSRTSSNAAWRRSESRHRAI